MTAAGTGAPPRDVLVVGASAAGLTVAETLRRGGYEGRLTLVGEEPHPPYDRPPLSKQVLAGDGDRDRAVLRDAGELAGLGVELLLGRRAADLDAGGRTVGLDDGRRVPYDALVIATGLTPRRLPFGHGLTGVHTLRTLDDSLALRAALPDARHVAVVGAGVLGCEIAATARALGRQVTLVDPLSAPMVQHLGHGVGAFVADLHTGSGVHLRLGRPVAGLGGDRAGRVSAVELAGGESVPADLVVLAIGSAPATGWLAGSGLALDDGIVCDAYCRAAPGIFAAGDVARWHHEGIGRTLRLENRTNATAQAMAVAANLLGEPRPYVPVPYFWTDQYTTRIQVHGTVPPDARVRIVDGSVREGRFALLALDGERPVAAVGWNHPKGVLGLRREILPAWQSAATTAA